MIKIPQDKFKILDHNKFSPSTENLFRPPYANLGARGFIICTANPTEKQKQEYGYMPYLTIIKAARSGGFAIDLKIQFSAPKLLYGNNFDELSNADLPLIVKKLFGKLPLLGIYVSEEDLLNAQVTTIHPSKNLVFETGIHPNHIMAEINKCNISRVFDLNSSSYRTGHAIRLHTNSSELIFYDKIEDLKQSKKSESRSIENDNQMQLPLLDFFETKPKIEVLRMELRLNTMQMIRQAMKELGKDFELTLNNLFDTNTSKELLKRKWQMIEKSYPIQAQVNTINPEELAATIMINNPEIRLNTLFEVIGYSMLINKIGIRDSRALLKKYGNRNWLRTHKKLDSYNNNLAKPDFFGQVEKQLENFEQVTLAEYGSRM